MTIEKVSPLFSLQDPFEFKPKCLNEFEDLGEAAFGVRHVTVFFRNVVGSKLDIDYKNPIRPTKYCTVYNIVNSRGTVYAVLFVVAKDHFIIHNGNHMKVMSNSKVVGDYAFYPCTGEKNSVLLYRDSSYNLLININNANSSKFVVLDD